MTYEGKRDGITKREKGSSLISPSSLEMITGYRVIEDKCCRCRHTTTKRGIASDCESCQANYGQRRSLQIKTRGTMGGNPT